MKKVTKLKLNSLAIVLLSSFISFPALAEFGAQDLVIQDTDSAKQEDISLSNKYRLISIEAKVNWGKGIKDVYNINRTGKKSLFLSGRKEVLFNKGDNNLFLNVIQIEYLNNKNELYTVLGFLQDTGESCLVPWVEKDRVLDYTQFGKRINFTLFSNPKYKSENKINGTPLLQVGKKVTLCQRPNYINQKYNFEFNIERLDSQGLISISTSMIDKDGNTTYKVNSYAPIL